MKPISVLVPTADQPKLLETALQSIANQTAADQIHEVIVSENLRNRQSQQVCRKFSSLPIRYVLQDPPVSQVQNFDFLFNEAKGDLVALLCDDDWWGPGHLQGAILALVRDKDAVARFSAGLHVASEDAQFGVMDRSSVLWLAAGRPSFCVSWRLDRTQTLAAAWILTPFHASSGVVRRTALHKVAPIVKTFHAYQADRALQAHLGTLGPVLYEPLVEIFVRSHSEALTLKVPMVDRREAFRKCTEAIWGLSEVHGVDLVGVWQDCLAEMDGETLEETGKYFRIAFNDRELKAHGFDKLGDPHPLVKVMRRARTIAKNRWQMYRPGSWTSLGLPQRWRG